MNIDFDYYKQLMAQKDDIPSLFDPPKNLDKETWKANEITLNERQKRELRKKIVGLVKWFSIIQLLFFNVVVAYIIFSCTVNVSWLKPTNVESMLDFLKYYIGATIVELLGLMGFIIRFVFSEAILNKKFDKRG